MKRKWRDFVVLFLIFSMTFVLPVYADDSTEIANEDQEILNSDYSEDEANFENDLQSELVDVQDDYNVFYTGDFSKVVSGYIIIYPDQLTNSNKKWPVIVWANGTACAPVLYWNALCALASKGYIIVASSDTMSANGKSQVGEVDYILTENESSDSIFYNKVDETRIGAAGHSQGGRSAVNAAKLDDRIKAVVSIAGSNTSNERSDLDTPTLFLTGTADLVVLSSLWVKPTYKQAVGPAAYASLKGGIHTSVINNYDSIVYYTSKWMDAYLNDNNDSRAIFMDGGQLFSDTSWKDVQSKSVNLVSTSSIFGNVSVSVIIGLSFILCIIGIFVIRRKKRG